MGQSKIDLPRTSLSRYLLRTSRNTGGRDLVWGAGYFKVSGTKNGTLLRASSNFAPTQ